MATSFSLAEEEAGSCQQLMLALHEVGAPSGVSLAKRCVVEGSSSAVSQALAMAIGYRYEDIALALLRQEKDTAVDRMAIRLAAYDELPRVVAALLKRDSSLVNAKDEYQRTPLLAAADGGAYMAARVLLENGADPNLGNPLLSAVTANRPQIAYLLMEHGATWTASPSNKDGAKTSLVGAAALHGEAAFLHYLYTHGHDLNQVDPQGNSALRYTLNHKDERVGYRNWVYLANHGVDPLMTICRLTQEEVRYVRDKGPKWFMGQLEIYRPKCTKAQHQ